MASVAEVIRSEQAAIVADWIVKAQSTASARGLSGPTFTNQMPMFLAALAEGMGGAGADAAARSRAEALGHLGTRIRQGFELSEMVSEFDILEHSIVTACAKALSAEQPDKAEMERLHEQIRDAITDVTDAYFHHVMEDEQAEKRYSRLLQDIATEALRDERRPLRERLHDVLEVVVDAMSVRTAAFLLFDVHEDRLVAAASIGDEIFEQYATSLERASFAGQVARSATATSMRDVTSTVLEVPESLRKSGIHSVLGVRIPPRSDLQGILYVGVTEIREFTTREIHRLELLADRLGLHLDNARLFADLRKTIETLRVERGMREHFVATLAHDLRGPLSSAGLAAGLLADQPTNLDRRKDLATRIGRNIERVDRMIRDLLDANRIHAGEPLPLQLASCDLCGIAVRVGEEARALYGDRFIIECDGVRGVWSADELHRALWNMVSNAVKYGAAKLPITIKGEGFGEQVRLSVHNFGAPIPAGELSSLFHAFHRAPDAETSGQAGWGLGLTLVRGCAEAHGGYATVVSDQTGTTFALELPVDALSVRRRESTGSAPSLHAP